MRLISVLLLLLFFSFSFSRTDASNLKKESAEWLSKQGNKGFIENRGQMVDMNNNPVPRVLFKTEAPGLNFWITEQGVTIQTFIRKKEPIINSSEVSASNSELPTSDPKPNTKKTIEWERIDIELKNGTIKKENVVKENPTPGHFNFFYPHCADGVYEVKEYQKVTIKNVYPNVDWVFYRKIDGTLKYDFVVHPGANYQQIELLYKSKTPITINELGELELYTQYGNVKENTPVSFYNGEEVETRFVQQYQTAININEDNGYETSIKFSLSGYSPSPSGRDGEGLLIIDPQLTWSTLYGSNGVDGTMAIDTDNNGNLFLTGYTGSSNFPTQALGGGYFQGNLAGGIGSNDIFILKFNNAGVRLWATYYGGTNLEMFGAINVDNNGNCFVVGSTLSDDFPVQSNGPSFQDTRAVGYDVFILKFNNNGTRIWATYYSGSAADIGHGVTTDAMGNVFVTGSSNSANLPRRNNGTYFQSANAGGMDVFILKFTNAGILVWATYYGGTNGDEATSIDTDASGNIYVVGTTTSLNDFPVQNSLMGWSGSNDAFILKFDNAGNRLWATYYGGNAFDQAYSVATDAVGNVFVLGYTESANFPTQSAGTYFDGTRGGASDAFILKFDNAGNRLWATYYGGSNTEHVGPAATTKTYDKIAIDACGNVHLFFETKSTNIQTKAACDGGYVDNVFNGESDQFIVRFSNQGELLWASYVGGNKNDVRCAVAVDGEGNVFVSGEWYLAAPATGTSNTSFYPLVDPGNGAHYSQQHSGIDDLFIVKFSPSPLVQSVNSVDAACLCDGTAAVIPFVGCAPFKYTWYNNTWSVLGVDSSIGNLCSGNYSVIVKDTLACSIDTAYVVIAGAVGGAVNISHLVNICSGGTYTLPDGSVTGTSGVYTHTFVSSLGCDSIITTTLLIGNPINTSESYTVCSGQSVLIHGVNQNITGVYTQTFVAVGGCDSISEVTLVISPITSHTVIVNTCNTYTHNGQTYNISGIYTQTLVGSLGCDSVLTIDLTINTPVITNNTVTICQGQTTMLHGVPQTTAGVYTQTFTAVNNCDSISVITLQVNPIVTSIVSITACQGQTVSIHGIPQNTAGVFTQTFTAANGCDSISTIQLLQTPVSTHTITVGSCNNYSHNGQTYTTSGTYTQVLTNSVNCDSILTINLTITATITTQETLYICEGEIIVIHGIPQNTAGVYTQTYTSVSGCDSIAEVSLNIYPSAIALFEMNPNPSRAGNTIRFTDYSQGATSWNWSFGDILNSSSTQQHPNFFYTESGIYQIQLVVNNIHGCTDTTTQNLIIEDDFVLYTPNTFTPNGDNVNDMFLPKGDGIDTEEFELYIFDRWGSEIFKSINPLIGWDGRANNGKDIAQIDTYVWLVKVKDINGKAYRFIGHVNLIR